jgi:hypothetical protein
MNDYEQSLQAHMAKCGCSVTSVFDPDGNEPDFSYSIGIGQSSKAPDLIVVGLKREIGHWLVNEYNRRVQAGERFSPGVLYDGFLEGFAVQFTPVDPPHRAGYMRSAVWLYGGSDFEALQLLWPSTRGLWPWDPEAGEWFKANQPLLGPLCS